VLPHEYLAIKDYVKERREKLKLRPKLAVSLVHISLTLQGSTYSTVVLLQANPGEYMWKSEPQEKVQKMVS